MSYQEDDSIADSGESFIGQGISDQGTVGVVQLWNPWGSGKVIRLDLLSLAGSGPIVGDLRYTKEAIGAEFVGHTANKVIDGQSPVAKIMQSSSAAVDDYPYNRPHHEFWNPVSNDDKQYKFSPAIKIPQGRGVAICLANSSKCIASFQWREQTDPLGPVYEPGPISDMLNPDRAFDGISGSYATSNGDASSVTIGYDYVTQVSANQVTVKSPPDRSFCGAVPSRSISYSVLSSNDLQNWSAVSSGSFTDSGQSTQATLSVQLGQLSFRALKVVLSDGLAGWRIDEFSVS